jgi:hypothetical protein
MSVQQAPPTRLADSRQHRRQLLKQYQSRIAVNPALSRVIVSNQGNKSRAFYRWFKYKEGFSARLIEYVLARFGTAPGRILDPFAGCGAALFCGRDAGWDSIGIELLPLGVLAIRSRLVAESVPRAEFLEAVGEFERQDWESIADPSLTFPHLTITRSAFPPKTERAIAAFRTYVRDKIRNPRIRELFNAACLSVLESVSFTRKDGQYLRWDSRAPRQLPGKKFSKGPIFSLPVALRKQFDMMLADMGTGALFPLAETAAGCIDVHEGSCLQELPSLESRNVDLVVTSPPYCNRYDYTRTYALELAYLGVDEDRLKELRQSLLSCTVENRAKVEELRQQYREQGDPTPLDRALSALKNRLRCRKCCRCSMKRPGAGSSTIPTSRGWSAITFWKWPS